LEEYEHAIARGATILAEVCGYGFSSNGIEDISAPSADAEYIAMKRALDDAGILPSDIDYVNAHGTSTPIGDVEEAKALTQLFGANNKPYISSTKSMTGHEMWMAGASEIVYSMLMMQNNFVAANLNFEEPDEASANINIPSERVDVEFDTFLSNSFGFGGTNSSLVVKKFK
jgi:3-oxoacyl-[acyl-carrier-protein] synthase-1